MSGTITLTAAMRANLLSLQQTGNSLSTTQLHLATGNKVNSALDNPVNFFAAQALNHRASQLSALLDGMGQGIQTIQAANQGLTTITTLVNQLTSIANSAKTNLSKTTSVNTLEGAGGTAGLNSDAVADLTSTAAGSAVTAGDSFSLQDGSGVAHTFTIDAVTAGGVGTSLQDIVDAINQVSGFSASIVYGDGSTKSASTVDGNGAPSGTALDVGLAYLKVVSTDGQTITAHDVNGTSALAGLGLTDGATSKVVKTGGGDTADIANYASVIAQINQTVTDSNYQGNNLLAGAAGQDLTVQVNELSTGAITVTKVDATASGLALSANANSWTSSAAVDADIAKINAALSTLETQAAGFANSLSLLQTRQDFTSNLINTLQSGATSLTIADKNEEGANLLALQTQQQLGIEALSLSSQANQSVLRLFA